MEGRKRISEFNRIILLTIFLFAALFFSGRYLINQIQENNLLNKPKQSIKIVERHIAGTEKTINNYERLIGDEKKIIRQITDEIDKLRLELTQKKASRDTLQILKIQDTLINSLTHENKRLYTVIDYKDSIIYAQRYIIDSKDTIIVYQNNIISAKSKQHRKLKWRTGVIAGVAILEAGVIILQNTTK